MKPFGKSFNTKTPGKNSKNHNHKNSIWHYDPPTGLDKEINRLTSLTKFTQSDLTTLAKGGASVVVVSLYPLEKGFVLDKLGNNITSDTLKNLVMGIGKKRIDHIQNMSNYFDDLSSIYDYYKQLDGVKVIVDNQKFSYRLVNSYEEIVSNMERDPNTINLILTIEGANVFNTGLSVYGRELDENEVLNNIEIVKSWDHKVFFITFAHHFYNELCGQAKTMKGLLAKLNGQNNHSHKGFTQFGEKVLRKLLDDTDGQRIMIDIKHLSVNSRKRFYEILEQEYGYAEIPIIVSHGAVTGTRSFDEYSKIDMPGAYTGKFNSDDINFYDDELAIIAESDGLFGVMLDERRVAGKKTLRKARKGRNRKEPFRMSKLIWNQIQHIAEVLNSREMYAWGIQCIGSDFDGMVNPIDGFWTSEYFPLLEVYLERHAEDYLRSEESNNLKSYNRISAEEIIDRFMIENAMEFFKENF